MQKLLSSYSGELEFSQNLIQILLNECIHNYCNRNNYSKGKILPFCQHLGGGNQKGEHSYHFSSWDLCLDPRQPTTMVRTKV